MRVAVGGPEDLNIDISRYIPEGTTEIICCGNGACRLAERYADERGIPKLVIKPRSRFKISRIDCVKAAIEAADVIVIVYKRRNLITCFVAGYANRLGKTVYEYEVEEDE